MESAGVENAAEVRFCRRLFVWMDKGEEGFSDKKICLCVEMRGKNGIEVDELEFGREQGPVWEQ